MVLSDRRGRAQKGIKQPVGEGRGGDGALPRHNEGVAAVESEPARKTTPHPRLVPMHATAEEQGEEGGVAGAPNNASAENR